MQKINDKVDPYGLIMRNPEKSLSSSKQSSKFGEPFNHYIEVPQFNGYNEPQIQGRFNQFTQGENKQMKYMYSFCEQNFKISNNNNNKISNRDIKTINAVQNCMQPKKDKEEFNLAQRLTFENQASSPFIRIQPPSKIMVQGQQTEMRHSFNPLQNKVNELQRMCKKLYQITLQQNRKSDTQRQSFLRIQRKVDYIIQKLQRNSLRQIDSSKLATRSSHQNKRKSSTLDETDQRKKIIQDLEQNSSEQLSRYLQPPSTDQSIKIIPQINNKVIADNKTSRVRPFIVNSNFEKQNTLLDNCSRQTIQFKCHEDQNKENVNLSNIVYHQNNLRKLNSQKDVNQQSMRNKKPNKHPKTKNQQIRKSKNKKTQLIQPKQVIHPEEKIKAKVRTQSQNITYRKINQQKNNQPTYYYASLTTTYEQDLSRYNNITYKSNRNIDSTTVMQNSEIFQAVDFPFTQLGNKTQKRQSQSTQLHKNHNKNQKQNHHRTLLESIQEKKRLIDNQLSKRLMKNSSTFNRPLISQNSDRNT